MDTPVGVAAAAAAAGSFAGGGGEGVDVEGQLSWTPQVNPPGQVGG